MDLQESLKRSDDLAKSRGLSSQIQSLNRSMLRRNEGSVRTFTATETALLAAPYEDTPRLDLAAVVATEGDRRAAERMLRDDVSNRTADGDAPDDLPERTAELVSSAPWLKKGRVA